MVFVDPVLNSFLLEKVAVLGSHRVLNNLLGDGAIESLSHILRILELVRVSWIF